MNKTTLVFPLRKAMLCLIFGILTISYYTNSGFAAEKTKITKNDDVDFIVLEGSPYNRGLIHGKTLKEKISQVMFLWKNDIQKNYKSDPDEFITRFLKKTDFVTAIKKYTPDLYEEVKGISEGSGIDFNSMLAFQLVDEVWMNWRDVMGEHCSSVGVNRKGPRPAMIGQNMDIEGFRNGFQTILYIKYEDSDMESLVFTCAGLIALNGMNNMQVGVCVNAVQQLNYSTKGLPVAFVIRGLLNKTSQEKAIEFLKKIDHASPQNYVIGGPEKIYDFECSPNKINPFEPYQGSEVIYHTNHPIVNDDYNPAYKEYIKDKKESQIRRSNSYIRYECINDRFRALSGDIVLTDLKEILSSRDSDRHPVSRPFINISRGFTFGSTIMVFSKEPELFVSYGPPTIINYKKYKFSK